MEVHFDFVVDGITMEQASTLLESITEKVEGMEAFLGGGFNEYTWVDTVVYRFAAVLYVWRNRLNRLLGRNPWHTGRAIIGDAVYAPPEGGTP